MSGEQVDKETKMKKARDGVGMGEGERQRGDTVPLLAQLSFMWTPAPPQRQAVEKTSPGEPLRVHCGAP